jgi:ABC-type amino acid transport system permease subunit
MLTILSIVFVFHFNKTTQINTTTTTRRIWERLMTLIKYCLFVLFLMCSLLTFSLCQHISHKVTFDIESVDLSEIVSCFVLFVFDFIYWSAFFSTKQRNQILQFDIENHFVTLFVECFG